MTNISLDAQVAVLIDADNIQSGYLEKVLKISEYYGELIVRRAFGIEEESAQSSRMKEIAVLKIKYEQNRHVGEHAADGYLLIKVGTLLEGVSSEGSPNVFIIVSGDGIYASACMMVRESGKQVICIGNKKQMSKGLETTCDGVYLFEDLDSELEKLRQSHPIPPNEVREFFNDLLFAYHRFLPPQKWDWVSLSVLGQRLREVDPDYETKFGKYKLSALLRSVDTEFKNVDQKVRRIDTHPESTRWGLIVDAYIQTKNSDGFAPLDQLDQAIRVADPDYNDHFGAKKVSEWLETYSDSFKIHGDGIIHQNYWSRWDHISGVKTDDPHPAN